MIPNEKRQKAIDKPGEWYLDIRNAMSYLPDGKGDQAGITDFFGKEFKEQGQRLLYTQTQKNTEASKLSRRPRKDNMQGSISTLKESLNEARNETPLVSSGERAANEGQLKLKAKAEEKKFEFDPETYEFPIFHPISKDLHKDLLNTAQSIRHAAFMAATKKSGNELIIKMNETYQAYVEAKKTIDEMEKKLNINQKLKLNQRLPHPDLLLKDLPLPLPPPPTSR